MVLDQSLVVLPDGINDIDQPGRPDLDRGFFQNFAHSGREYGFADFLASPRNTPSAISRFIATPNHQDVAVAEDDDADSN